MGLSVANQVPSGPPQSAREADRRKDWAEKTSTDIARRFDVIRVEDLNIRGMTRSAKGTAQRPGRNVRAKAGLYRGICRSGWGPLVRRLEDKALGRATIAGGVIVICAVVFQVTQGTPARSPRAAGLEDAPYDTPA